MTIKKCALQVCLTLLTCTLDLDASTITRAAFDVGSSGIKISVAEIDPCEEKIQRTLYSDEIPVHFKKDMVISGQPYFSEKVQKKALEIFRNIYNEVSAYSPDEWTGIATSAFRQSVNATELNHKVKDELGITIHIISQEEEGRVGFMTASVVSGIAKENLISLDSGSASFQLAAEVDDKMQTLGGDVGYTAALQILIEEMRHKSLAVYETPNPISRSEAVLMIDLLKARLPELSEAFATKLKDSNATVVGIGNENFIFSIAARALGKNTYTKEELWQAIESHCGKTDFELQNFVHPDEVLIGMILLYSMMEGLEIPQITYAYANGSCEGLLIDRHYWTVFDVMENAIASSF